jgi:hypothetical protein
MGASKMYTCVECLDQITQEQDAVSYEHFGMSLCNTCLMGTLDLPLYRDYETLRQEEEALAWKEEETNRNKEIDTSLEVLTRKDWY